MVYILKYFKLGISMFNTQLNIDSNGRSVKVMGNFIADMENDSLLFMKNY